MLRLICAGITIVSAHSVHAQDTHEVIIRLHRAGDTTAIRNAPVTVDHVIEAGNTDSTGRVRIPDLEDGGHIVEAVATGYEAMFESFKSGPNIKQPIDFEMAPVPPRAAPKGEATGLHFADFERRRVRAVGTFFTHAQLDKATGRPLSNFLKVDATATIVPGPRGESFVASESPASAASPCYAAVVRDGIRIYPYTGATPPDLDKIFTEELAALEFYRRPALVPAELKDASACGALVIWTRSGNP
ncbi:MAG TPA: hypothetical protein VK760_06460 [Candidatus Acidoferrales bacterium]|jgi:hypothetical protein|nr:hypothetical protein [Candidatus Acidoferrales bacterium]